MFCFTEMADEVAEDEEKFIDILKELAEMLETDPDLQGWNS